MCQVIFTNPVEIIKIRKQVAGEIHSAVKHESTIKIVKELGFLGLYKVSISCCSLVKIEEFCNNYRIIIKGVRACLLRDIPFSMIFFPAYSHMKKNLADEYGHNDPLSLFCSGFVAGK